jgi:alpha,alpha-trehalase
MTTTASYSALPFFAEVQLRRIFPDGKTFVDCSPKRPLQEIINDYFIQKEKQDFDLEAFILSHFDLPVPHSSNYRSDSGKSVLENIEALWPCLTRVPGNEDGTLIALPYPYIVPGGRFGEIYYWDSYFTMLGLKESRRHDMIENMVNNFSFLLDSFGYIPNGNRQYFIGRSQPPFYSLMVKLLASIRGNQLLTRYLPQLMAEHRFWMDGQEAINEKNPAVKRVVRLPGGQVLNRYWDQHDTPRPESYREDVKLSHLSAQPPEELFRHLRAGAESGWDYSCRWFKDKTRFDTIHTCDIIPVDLNCLLWHLEMTIAEASRSGGEKESADHFEKLARQRGEAIRFYCWHEEMQFYVDYDFKENRRKQILALAGITPLFFSLANTGEAERAAAIIEQKFLQPGGVLTSLEITGQQWDAPNGWAPLHWMAIIGLENYGYHALASTIARRWIKLNTDVFRRTGKLMEKYNVADTHLEAGGGEYEGQDGFGWTNGVLASLIKKYGAEKD